jgi:segregation and condensation protein B
MMDDSEHLRLIEAILFQSSEPVSERELSRRLPEGADLGALLKRLAADYAHRGITLTRAGGSWAFNTANDVEKRLSVDRDGERRLSRAAIETLAIVAYHQPVTRGEIEEIRGVRVGRGILDVLFANGWIRLCGRRKTPGRPALWATTDAFLRDFSLRDLDELPRIEDVSAAGLIDLADPARGGHAVISQTAD